MGGPGSYNEEMNPAYSGGGMGMEDGPHLDGEDAEMDNRIKELLLSVHNVFLISQAHEKELSELAPVVKNLPQMIGNVVSRSIGDISGVGEDGKEGVRARPAGEITPTMLLLVAGGMSVLTSVLTVGFLWLVM